MTNNSKNRVRIPQVNKIRAELQKEIGSKCPFCDNTDVGHFEIHHIDENPSNNDNGNLILLCPICHSKITKSDISQAEVFKKKIELITEGLSIPKNTLQVNGDVKHSIIGNNNIVKVSTPKKTVKQKYPEGCIGFDVAKANYVSHLINRYHEYKEWEVGKENMKYGVFPASLKKHFKIGATRTIYNLPIESFDELILLIQKRINGTTLAKKKGKGHKNFSSFDEYVALLNKANQ